MAKWNVTATYDNENMKDTQIEQTTFKAERQKLIVVNDKH